MILTSSTQESSRMSCSFLQGLLARDEVGRYNVGRPLNSTLGEEARLRIETKVRHAWHMPDNPTVGFSPER